MGGLSLIFAPKREKIAGFITLGIMIALALATAGDPKHTIIDGKEVIEAVILGHVVPKWLFFVVGLPIIGGIYFGVHAVLNRFWPEKTEVFEADKVYQRPEGGSVAWQGDDPEAGSPLDYAAPRLVTALDYLQAEEPAPMRVLILGDEGAREELRAFHDELNRWLEEASEELIDDLIPTARSLPNPGAFEIFDRLTEAYYHCGQPTLDQLEAFAQEFSEESALAVVKAMRSEKLP
jgi:hypothetical protein